METARGRAQRRHVREKATIDHLVRDVYEPKMTPDEKHTERSPTTSTGLPVEDQVSKEWKAALARIPRFFGDKRQITSVTELPMPAMPSPPRLRKRPLEANAATSAADEIDIAGCAAIAYTSEDPAHPVEHMLDGSCGPGATRWISARPDTTEQIVIEFDRPQAISRLVYEVEETTRERTQEDAWKPRKTAANRTAKFWFRNTTSAPGEPPISAKNSASISARSPISVSRLFQTRAAPARRR